MGVNFMYNDLYVIQSVCYQGKLIDNIIITTGVYCQL